MLQIEPTDIAAPSFIAEIPAIGIHRATGLAGLLAKLSPERSARAKAFQGQRANRFGPRTVVVRVPAKANAPCRRQPDAEELARAIREGNTNLPQVDSFHTEVDADAQRIFAAELAIPEDILLRIAKALASTPTRSCRCWRRDGDSADLPSEGLRSVTGTEFRCGLGGRLLSPS